MGDKRQVHQKTGLAYQSYKARPHLRSHESCKMFMLFSNVDAIGYGAKVAQLQKRESIIAVGDIIKVVREKVENKLSRQIFPSDSTTSR